MAVSNREQENPGGLDGYGNVIVPEMEYYRSKDKKD